MAEWADLIRQRRMTRAFRPDPIDADLVMGLIEDASRAPSAGKTQGWHAVMLGGDQTARFWDATLPVERRPRFAWPDLLVAPVLLVIVSDPDAYVARYLEPDKQHTGLGGGVERWPTPYWTVDASMAAMCILLGAQNVGLGALFFGIFNGQAALRQELGLPDSVEFIGAIALGYPLSDDTGRNETRAGRSAHRPRRPATEIVHQGRW